MFQAFRAKFFAASLTLTSVLFALHAQASVTSSKEATAEEFAQALKINENYLKQPTIFNGPQVGQPVLETEKFKYILMAGSDGGDKELYEMHRTFAENLPADMILIAVTESYVAKTVEAKFAQWLPKGRFIVATGKNLGDLSWGRDAYPFPIYRDTAGNIELVAHKYQRAFNASKLIADAVNAPFVSNHNFVFVGGNLQASARGDCFIIDSRRTFGMEDETYLSVFRCRTVTRFPHIVGIGDVDETLKVLPNNVILLNQISYKETLEDMGYKVVMLPEVPRSFRTYANSVILNDSVFMPTYGLPSDLEATKVYESMGYKVHGIRSNGLSDYRHGSIHCLTMTYPDLDVRSLMNSLGLSEVQ